MVENKKLYQNSRNSNYALISLFFIVGFFSQIVQIILVREIFTLYHGNEVAFGVFFAVWLFWGAAGSIAGVFLIKRFKSSSLLLLSIIAVLLITPLEVYILRIGRVFFSLQTGEVLTLTNMVILSFISLSAVCIWLGLLFAAASSLISSNKDKKEGSQRVPLIYAADALGMITGGVLFSFLLVSCFGAFQSLFLASFLFCISAFFISRFLWKNRFMRVGLLVLSILSVLGFISGKNLEWASQEKAWSLSHTDYKLEKSVVSKYGDLALLEYKGEYTLFVSGEHYFSVPDIYTPAGKAHIAMSLHPSPRKVLLIGGGVNGLIREMLLWRAEEIHYVELDSLIIDTVREYLTPDDNNALNDLRVKIHNEDGRKYVLNTKEKFDLVIVNLPEPLTASINRFYTLEFFNAVKRILTNHGVLAVSFGTSVFSEEEETARDSSILLTLNQVFEFAGTLHGEFFVASDSEQSFTLEVEELIKRYEKAEVNSAAFHKELFHTFIEADAIERANTLLKESVSKDKDKKLLNTDNQPIAFYYGLLLLSRGNDQRTFTNI
ncbi:MAG: hypothetical protein ABIH42_11050 [Planctomycetota bacterium]